MTELLPCPFCGDKPIWHECGFSNHDKNDCWLTMMVIHDFEKWNTRATEGRSEGADTTDKPTNNKFNMSPSDPVLHEVIEILEMVEEIGMEGTCSIPIWPKDTPMATEYPLRVEHLECLLVAAMAYAAPKANPGDRIVDGLKSAIDYAKGDKSQGVLTRIDHKANQSGGDDA